MQFEERPFADNIFYLRFMTDLFSSCWLQRGFVDYIFN